MTVVRILGSDESAVLSAVASGVFDLPIRPELAGEFLADPRHHLAVAIAEGVVVGMASAVHYVHPDKSPELWINEVGVAPSCQGQGLGGRLVGALLEHGRSLGCREAWVLTEASNEAANALYQARGGARAETGPILYSWTLTPGG